LNWMNSRDDSRHESERVTTSRGLSTQDESAGIETSHSNICGKANVKQRSELEIYLL
jgi:hypothetical protein